MSDVLIVKVMPCSSLDRVQLKGTMWWIYYIMNKAFVWAAHILNSGPESSTSSFELRSKTSQNWRGVSHSSCTSHQRPVTFVLLIVLHFFKGLAGTIGHLSSFYVEGGKKKFLVLPFTLGKELPRAEGFHLLAWLHAIIKNKNRNYALKSPIMSCRNKRFH